MSGDPLTIDEPGNPLLDVAIARKMTNWLRQRTEPDHLPSERACRYTAAFIDVLCAHIQKLYEENQRYVDDGK